MAKRIINIGTTANDKSGDPLRTAATKINDNFGELYLYLGNGTELTVAAVAKTGSYNSLVDRPNLALYQLKSDSFSGDYNDLRNKPIAFSGNYNDLANKPDLTQFQTKSEAFSGNYSDLFNRPDLSLYQLKTETFSGNYNDLTNKPTLFSGSYVDLTNKPNFAIVATTGSYNNLTDKPTLFSGSYVDLTNKPTLFSGSYNDLTNKPALFTGSYNDLTDKPTIPSDVSDLTDTQGLLGGGSNNLSTEAGNGDLTGPATSITVTNGPNINWVSTSGITSGDMTLDVSVDVDGNATITIIEGGTSHAVNETGSIAGTAIGAATPEDDLQFTISSVTPTPVALPLNKAVLKLSDGRFTLANGSEGQMIRLVLQDGTTNKQTIRVTFANARVNGTTYQNIFMEPFASGQPDIVSILFTDGAWQSDAGLWD